MTESERERMRQAKAAAVERLAREDVSRYRLAEVDERLERYVLSVQGDPDGHCVWDVLAVLRFLGHVRRYGIDVGAVRRFARF